MYADRFEPQAGPGRSEVEQAGVGNASPLESRPDIAAEGFNALCVYVHVFTVAGQRERAVPLPVSVITALAVRPDGKAFAVGGRDGSLRILSMEGEVLRLLREPRPEASKLHMIRSLLFTPDGKTLVASTPGRPTWYDL